MKRTINIIAILILAFILTACNAAYCIKVEGSAGKYGIDDASVELCRDPVRSAQENAEVYVSNTGREFVLVDTKYIEQTNKRLAKKEANNEKESMMERFTKNVD
jgi:hypothetical protein